MPLFEHQHIGMGPDGKPVKVPPAEVLARAGPLLQVTVSTTSEHAEALSRQGEKPPDPINGWALIDTGASITAVDEAACRNLGLSPTGVVRMKHAAGEESRHCYPIQIGFPGTPLPALSNARTVSCNLGGDHLLLFGRDLLMNLRMVYHGPAGRIELAF